MPRAASAATTLKSSAAASGIEIGTAFGGLDWSTADLIAEQVSLVTPEWSLKPGFLKSAPHAPIRFAETDAIHDFCLRRGLRMHGHTLYWHGDPMRWTATLPRSEARAAYSDLADAVLARYPGTASWDVTNEIVSDTSGEALRTDAPTGRLGLDFIAGLYRQARRAAPGATLVLNDYNLECGQDWCTAKQARFLGVLDDLLARGAPLDAVGMQGHLSSEHGLNAEGTLAFIEAVAERGLAIHISELDVNDVAFSDAIGVRDEQVAAMMFDYLSSVLTHPAVTRVVFWGLTDRDHWLVRGEAEGVRANGQARPGLFDAELRAKPAYFAVLEALSAASPRR